MALAFVVLLGALLGCKPSTSSTQSGQPSQSSSPNPAIDRIIDAKNKHDSSEALRVHGPLQAEEVQYIYEAISSSDETRRRNAAGLLLATVKGNAVELQHKALLETKDAVVWAISDR